MDDRHGPNRYSLARRRLLAAVCAPALTAAAWVSAPAPGEAATINFKCGTATINDV